MPNTRSNTTKVSTLLHDIEEGSLALPSIQREFVWNDSDILKFVDSIYKNRPLGSQIHVWYPSLAVLELESESSRPLEGGSTEKDPTGFIIDGQQRLTSMLKLKNNEDFDLYFNPLTETFHLKSKERKSRIFNGVSDGSKSRSKFISVKRLWNDIQYYQTLKNISDLKRSNPQIFKDYAFSSDAEFVQFFSNTFKLWKNMNELEFSCVELIDQEPLEILEIFILLNSAGAKVTSAEKIILPVLIQSYPGIRAKINEKLKNSDNKYKFGSFSSRVNVDFVAKAIMYDLYGYTNTIANFAKEKYEEDVIKSSLENVSDGLDKTLSILGRDFGINSPSIIETFFSIQVLSIAVGNLMKNRTDKKITEVECAAAELYFLATNSKSRYSIKNHTALRKQDIDLARKGDIIALAKEIVKDHKKDNKGKAWFNLEELLEVNYTPGKTDGLMQLLGISLYLNGAPSFKEAGEKINFLDAHRHHIFPKSQMKDSKGNEIKDVHNIGNITFVYEETNKTEFNISMPFDYLNKIESFKGMSKASIKEKLRLHYIHGIDDEKGLDKDRFDVFVKERRQIILDRFNNLLDDYEEKAFPS